MLWVDKKKSQRRWNHPESGRSDVVDIRDSGSRNFCLKQGGIEPILHKNGRSIGNALVQLPSSIPYLTL